MDKPNALDFFRGEHRYNCAQAVLKAYAPATGVGESCLDRFSQFGSGRAPGGECGALFAAKSILEDPAAQKEVEREFVDVAGTTRCRDIRKGRRVSCEQCVQTAANAVFSQLTLRRPLQRPSECVS
jgi:hypothetical protein